MFRNGDTITLKGKFDKSESLLHGVVKFIVYARCKELGHEAELEFNTEGPIGIIDCIDFSTRLAYEVQKITNKKMIIAKTKQYLRYAEIDDVIFINLKNFDLDMSIYEIYEEIKKIVV